MHFFVVIYFPVLQCGGFKLILCSYVYTEPLCVWMIFNYCRLMISDSPLFSPDVYYCVAWGMLGMAVIVFLVLFKISAGYGMMYTSKWGWTVNNKTGWVLMELPSFVGMVLLWVLSPRSTEIVPSVMAILFLLHYFQRTFIFPFLMRGKNRMPISIMISGIIFNLINAYLIGGWLFYVSPIGFYSETWLMSPAFIIGVIIFLSGMGINLQSDQIVRNLRKPGDSKHYIPYGGMFRYVSSANYFGEFVEWVGYAVLTWSLGGFVFAVWTFANLAPRAIRINKRYKDEFGDEFIKLKRRSILPYIL